MKNILRLLVLSLLVASCKKDNAPSASAVQPDPFIRYDSANNVDHQIFQVYSATKVPIFYSDTVAKNPLTTLSVNYHIGGADGTYRLVYLKKDADKLTGINFANTQIIPHLTKNATPYSILLMDSVVIKSRNPMTFQIYDASLISYVATPTLAIGAVTKIANMGPDSLKSYRAYILASQLTAKLNLINYSALLNNFYSVSSAYYGKTITSGGKPKETFGLISIGNEGTTSLTGGTQADDFTRYLRLFMMNDYTALKTKYQSYPLVLNKFAYLQTALTTLGYQP